MYNLLYVFGMGNIYVIQNHRNVLSEDKTRNKHIYKIYEPCGPVVNAILYLFWSKNRVSEVLEIRGSDALIRNINHWSLDKKIYIVTASQNEIKDLFLEKQKTQALDFGKEKKFTRVDSDGKVVSMTWNEVCIVHISPADQD